MTLPALLWNLFFAFLSALAGVVLGVLWARQKFRKDRALRLEHLRESLIRAFRLNLDRIEQCLDYLQRPSPVIPNFRLDASSVMSVLQNGRELFEDAAFFDRCDWQRHQLDHLNAKMDQLHLHLASGSLPQKPSSAGVVFADNILPLIGPKSLIPLLRNRPNFLQIPSFHLR